MMNEVKMFGPLFDELFSRLEAMEETDKRWLAIGKTDLQKGLMSITRAIAKPDFF